MEKVTSVNPFYTYRGEKIYTPSEYLRLFGGNASGYIKRDTPANSDSSASNDSYSDHTSDNKSSNGGSLSGIVDVAVIIGILLLWSSLEKLSQFGAFFWIPFIAYIVLMILKKMGKMGKSAPDKHAASTIKSASKPASKPASETASKPVPASKPKSPSQKAKIVSCPHCKSKCRVPVGIGKIHVNCLNPACGQQYEVDT